MSFLSSPDTAHKMLSRIAGSTAADVRLAKLPSRTDSSSGGGIGTFVRHMCRTMENSFRDIFGETLEGRLDTRPPRGLCRQNMPRIKLVGTALEFQGPRGTAGTTYNFVRHFIVGIAFG